MKRCCDCFFWETRPKPRNEAAFGHCAIGRLPGLVPCYCETAEHCQSFTTGAASEEALAHAADAAASLSQQSQTRGIYPLPGAGWLP